MDDRIGELPDDILISILSRLTIDEAARANVLSYRWRYLWRSFTDNYFIPVKRRNFINLVDAILGLLQTKYLQYWIHQRLELDFNESKKGDHELHTFSPYSDTSSFSSLMSLRLTDVDIPEETLHYLLYYCPLLGELRPKVTERLMRIRVSGRSLYLKCLEPIWRLLCISKFPNLKHLEMTLATADRDCYHLHCSYFIFKSHIYDTNVLIPCLLLSHAVEPCIYVQNIKDDPHLNLRGVSFIGFEGREVDVEFLKDLLENAVR
ncbi:hypothetical protein KPL70_010837 [Citrus sinensis]|nr:hypothetical protein KPL70_010837 [Citrus sinensis]